MFSKFIEQAEIYATCAACGLMSSEVFCEENCPSCGLGHIEAVKSIERMSEQQFTGALRQALIIKA